MTYNQIMRGDILFWIPFIIIPPFIVLRVLFPKTAPKWICAAATALGGCCFGLIYIWKIYYYDTYVDGGISLPEGFILFSLPALYCTAYSDRFNKMWIPLIPAAVYFLFFFYCTLFDFFYIYDFKIIPNYDFRFDRGIGYYMEFVAGASVLSDVWALFCILVSCLVNTVLKLVKAVIKRRKNNTA
jgi:hypothetical protein